MRRTETLTLAALLGIGLLARLWVAFHTDYLIHPDESYDYLDQGFRLAFGHGQITWTYQHGLRSYLFPSFIAAVMRLAAIAGTPPAETHFAVTLGMVALSLTLIWAAWHWGRGVDGKLGGLITGFLVAIWFEEIYFAGHPLSEVIATDALVAGAWLTEDAFVRPTRRRLIWAGVFLGLALYQRIQIAPAIAVIGLWLLVRDGWRPGLWLAAGALLPFGCLGLLDGITYHYPFQSVALYLWTNIGGGVSDYYGRQPPWYFLSLEASYQSGAAGMLLLTCLVGAWRAPRLMLIAVSIIAALSLIGHKEYRFFHPALPFLCVLSGLGTSWLVRLGVAGLSRLNQWAGDRNRGALTMIACAVALTVWSLTSATLALEGPFKREWKRGSGAIAAARVLSSVPDLCGVGLYDITGSAMAGYSFVGRDVPYYIISTPRRFASDAVSFNAVLARDSNLPPGDDFIRQGCWANGYNEASLNTRMPAMCLLVRSGSCKPGAIRDIDRDRPPGY
jgi:GPI mannosyltransferase 3